MTGQLQSGNGQEKTGFVRLLINLLVLIVLAGVIAVLVWWGKGWRVDFGEGEGAPLEVLPGPVRVHQPTVAGRFYPGEPEALYAEVAGALASSPALGIRGVRAVLVPHAGYVFSGQVAAASFREVERGFRRVFLLASNHNGQVHYAGVSLPDHTHYAIPGAEIPLSAVVGDLRKEALFTHEPGAHTMHMLEVELPFLQQLRGRPQEADFAIVPMILGRMDGDAVQRLAEILDAYADPETLFVFSVDLSHFYPDQKALALDNYSIQAIMSRNREGLAQAETDGNQVLETLLALAERRGWEPTFLMSRNSGDVSGDKSRVVGYASIVFHEPFSLTEQEKLELLGFTRQCIEEHLRDGRASEPEAEWLERYPIFRIPRAVFVTLEKKGRLRGCQGELISRRPLYAGVMTAAINAAVRDPRFPPVREGELADLDVSISVLDHPCRMSVSRPEEYLEMLRPLKDGVILIHEGKRSTYLPQVWKDLPDPEQFLSRLSLKQGAPPDAWRSRSTILYRYGAYVFGEELISEQPRGEG
jgi:AmmeMemoRadiSam system protein B/AmmeMemoRadiSam system protein A